MGVEGIVVWLLALASLRVVKRVAVDAWEQIHGRPAPSLVERERRVELARRQFEATGVPSPTQAASDRIAKWIVDPPPQPTWVAQALKYLAELLADAFANARRRHADRQWEREHGEARGRGPFCWRCEVNRVANPDDLCNPCARRVTTPCSDCHDYVPIVELRDDRCATCRREAARAAHPSSSPRDDQPGPASLVVPTLTGPAWLHQPRR